MTPFRALLLPLLLAACSSGATTSPDGARPGTRAACGDIECDTQTHYCLLSRGHAGELLASDCAPRAATCLTCDCATEGALDAWLAVHPSTTNCHGVIACAGGTRVGRTEITVTCSLP